MTAQPTEAVIAGSKSFALALLAPLTERVGTRPRIAADPSQALKLTGGAGLVVVEFQGDRSLEAIRQMLEQAAGLSVIAAVPGALAGAEEALRSLGVEAARWDGKPDEVLTAVSRHLAGAATFAQVATSAAAPPPAATAAAVPAPSRVGALFDDIPLDDVPGASSSAEPLLPTPAAAGAAPVGGWPANVPSAAEAAEALARGLRHQFAPAGSPLAVVAESMAAMSPLERAVLLGEPQPIDPEPIRRAAVMRVRVAVALTTAPKSPGAAPVDAGAVSALLAEIDGLLSAVNAAVGAAPADLQPSLEQVRNALVKEAIDFSEAAHAAQPAEASNESAVDGQAAAIARKAAQTRIVSLASKEAAALEAAEARRTRWFGVMIAVAAVAAGAYHGWGFVQRRADSPPAPTVAGAPERGIVLAPEQAGAPRQPVTLTSRDGGPFTPAELKKLQDEQGLLGNTVQEVSPGVVVITPRAGPAR